MADNPNAHQVEQLRRFSAFVTDENITPERALEVWRTIASRENPDDVARLLTLFEAIAETGPGTAEFTAQIMEDPVLGAIAKRIITYWYLGIYRMPDSTTISASDHFRGLLWKVVHAHPPAMSDGYFGYWKYPPDH